jgi:hypothetical protein
VKRCGKSAPRLRQRNRHGKPHREQDRIGTATRTVRESDDGVRERCQARRPGRLLEATCKRCPRGMAVTYRPRERAMPYRTRLTGRLMSITMRGPASRAGPLAILQEIRPSAPVILPCGRHILPLLVEIRPAGRSGGRLEPRITLFPGNIRRPGLNCARRNCVRRRWMRGREQRHVEPGRPAVSDELRPFERRHHHQSLHRVVRPR